MDNESLARDLVVGYVAGHEIPEKGEMQKIAESLIEFYKLTKAELEKANANAPAAPIGFGSRSVEPKKPIEDQD
jgi:hypothetical protein